MAVVRRVRVFAGPNGSGKTTLFRALSKEHSEHGVFRGEPFVNADDVEHELRETRGVDLRRYRLSLSQSDVEQGFADLGWETDAGSLLRVNGVRLEWGSSDISPYTAAAIAALLREKMLIARRSFSFETVMSHPSKVEFLGKARAADYRTYLYFVATDAVELNVRRVEVRERSGGHAVPEQKIRERYLRSLALLPAALLHADRAYLFDNSSAQHVLLAEASVGKIIAIHLEDDEQPDWFRKLLSSLNL